MEMFFVEQKKKKKYSHDGCKIFYAQKNVKHFLPLTPLTLSKPNAFNMIKI